MKSNILIIAKSFFNALDDNGIKYSHWKSNEHLLDGLRGDTDLDILVTEHDREKLTAVFNEFKFKKVISQPWCRYPDIEDFIGYDEESGKLIHIHLHYKLLTGYKYVKELYLPYDEVVLETSIKDTECGIYMCSPEIEFIILIIRIAFKTSTSQLTSVFFHNDFLPGNILKEYSYLRNRIDRDKLKQYSHLLLGPANSDITEKIYDNNALKLSDIFSVRSILRIKYADNFRYGNLNVKAHYIFKKLQFIASRNINRYFFPVQIRKKPLKGGLIIAVTGCDGAGKSTVVNLLIDWLSWKIDTESVYLGSGDGNTGLALRIKKKLEQLIKSAKKRSLLTNHSGVPSSQNKNIIRTSLNHFIHSIFQFALARDRYKKVARIQKAKSAGKIVVTDRYPQNQYKGIYDGPQIKMNTGSIFKFNAVINKEQAIYDRISKMPPDVVIKLDIPFETSRKRKPEENPDIIRKKIEIHNKLQFGEAKTIRVNASQPLHQVISSIKTYIWDLI